MGSIRAGGGGARQPSKKNNAPGFASGWAPVKRPLKAVAKKKKKKHAPAAQATAAPVGPDGAAATSQLEKGEQQADAHDDKEQQEHDGGPAAAAPSSPAPAAAPAQPARVVPPPHVPFATEDHILLVGEGNFSFGSALAGLLGCAEQVVATSFDSQQELTKKYPDARRHIELITDLGGSVLHGVDARNLRDTKALAGKRFSKIVFNFPHVGAGIKDQARNILSNQQMLSSFFSSARQFLSSPSSDPVYTSQGPVTLPHGEIHITLKKGAPYDEWDVVGLAASQGLVTKTCYEFWPEWYEGYEHRRTIGFDATKVANAELVEKQCRTWVFVQRAAVAGKGRGRGKGGRGERGRGRGRGRGGRGAAPAGGKRQRGADSDSDSD